MRSWWWMVLAVSMACTASDDEPVETDPGDTEVEDTDVEDTDDTDVEDTDDTDVEDTDDTDDTDVEDTDVSPEGTPGCQVDTPLSEGEHTFELDGYDRRYIVRLPRTYSPDRTWPLIFALHGNGGTPDYWDGGGDRNIREAFQDEAVLILAHAIDNQWRDYSADRSTWPARIELELSYFDAVLAEAKDNLCLDEAQVFAMGFSGGGSFSGVLGCRREDYRGIAVGGSVIYFDPDNCVSTPAAWVTIGDGELSSSREDYRDFFRDRAGCEPTSTPIEPEGCVAYDSCNDDTPVVFCSHPAGHVWPSLGTDATRTFFRQFYAAE